MQRQLVASIPERGLSVRQTEELVRRLRAVNPTKTRAGRNSDGEMESLEEDLRRALGTKVLLARSRKGGRIVIEFYSDEEFSRLFDRLTGGVS
jgi:ParB family chromosome partitioning protein